MTADSFLPHSPHYMTGSLLLSRFCCLEVNAPFQHVALLFSEQRVVILPSPAVRATEAASASVCWHLLLLGFTVPTLVCLLAPLSHGQVLPVCYASYWVWRDFWWTSCYFHSNKAKGKEYLREQNSRSEIKLLVSCWQWTLYFLIWGRVWGKLSLVEHIASPFLHFLGS